MPETPLTEEQRAALQEKLKNMSPEQLREFQKQQCLFCRIIKKEIESKIVYEDGSTLAVLDINPAVPGHVILMPKEHYVISAQIPPKEFGQLFVTAKKLSHAILKGFRAQGTSIFVANGVAAGQKAQHFMVHLIPRFEGDNLFDLPLGEADEADLEKLTALLRKRLAEQAEGRSPDAEPSTTSPITPADSSASTNESDVSLEETPEEEKRQAKKKDTPKKKTRAETKAGTKNQTSKKKSKNNKESTEEDTGDEPGTNNNEGGEVSLDDIADLFK